MKTALDWFYDKIKSHFEHDGDLLETLNFTLAIAKEKEREQPDKLQTLIDWMEAELNKIEEEFIKPNMLMDKSSGIYYGLTQCINKAKELKSK